MGGGGMGGGMPSMSGGAQENAAASSSSTTPQTIDLNTLAAYVQQAQAQAQSRGAQGAAAASPSVPPGIQEALASLVKGLQQNPNQNQNATPVSTNTTNTTNATDGGSQQGADATMADADKNKTASDPQGLMEQVAQLTKSLDMEKAKSRVLQQEKAREMKGFLTGIRDFVGNLDGVKDPESKAKFLKGIENMADHGIPNGVYDIMVSASAQNEQNMRTIEALTKGYTDLKDRYEGAGSFTKESSRFVDPTIKIIEAGSKRKTTEMDENKVPLSMWDAFGDDIARVGYGHQKDLLSGF